MTFYSCTTSACSTRTSLGTGTLSSGKATYVHLGAARRHHLRRGDLWRLGELLGLDVERGDPGGQRALDHLEPHLVAQPLDLRHLGHLHRHRLGFVGHPEWHSELLRLLGLGLHPGRLARDRDLELRARPPSPPRSSRSARPTSMPSTAASGNYAGSTSNLVSEVVTALSTTSSLTSSANPSTLRLLGHLHRHGVGVLGHTHGQRHLLQLHHLGVLFQDLARDRRPSRAAGPRTRRRVWRSAPTTSKRSSRPRATTSARPRTW